MDPNLPENLDPKLKEAYERMMGQKPINPVVRDQPNQETQNTNLGEQQPLYQTQESAPDIYKDITEEQLNQNNQNVELEETSHQGHKNLSKVIIIVAIVFLLGYTIVWAKILNLL